MPENNSFKDAIGKTIVIDREFESRIFRIELPLHKKQALLALLAYINNRETAKKNGSITFHTDNQGRTEIWEENLKGGVNKSQ